MEKNIRSAAESKFSPVLISVVVTGVLYGLLFPPVNFSSLAWFSFIPFLYFLPTKGSSRFVFGTLKGWIANFIIFSWVWKTFEAAGIGALTTIGAWLALSFIIALYFGLFAFLYPFLPSGLWRPWCAGALWVILESIRSHILTGFPWALFGHTLVSSQALIQLCSLTGVAGLSFLLIGANSILTEFIRERNRPALLNLGLFVVLLTVITIAGWIRLGKASTDQGQEFKAALLQGNIDQYKKWDRAHEAHIRNTYAQLVQEAATLKPDVIIWPESSVPGWFPNDERYKVWISSLAQKTRTPHLVAAVSSVAGKEYNALYHIDEQGIISGVYNKMKLVPFGEYVPFGGFLSRWIPYLGKLGEFDAGKRHTLFSLKGFIIAPNICYEAVFSGLIRTGVNRGADLIVNVTNDGWYLNTGAPEQHYVTNVFRAVEMGRPVLRAANTGISGIIDRYGQEVVRSPLLAKGVFVGTVDVDPNKRKTVYALYGSWFVVLCWIAMFCILLAHVTRIKRKNRSTV